MNNYSVAIPTLVPRSGIGSLYGETMRGEHWNGKRT